MKRIHSTRSVLAVFTAGLMLAGVTASASAASPMAPAVPKAPMAASAPSAGVWLVTPNEAARVKAPKGAIQQLMSAHAGPGPEILVKNPQALDRVHAPVNILVKFLPGKSGLSPDMSTLRATLIGFFNIDLTDRIKAYIKGNELDVEGANLPTGSHRIRLAIADTKGNLNERDLDVTILESN